MSPNQFLQYQVDSIPKKLSHQGLYDTVDIDAAIQLTGYGRFHYKLVAVCALCLLINGLQNGLAAYIFPGAQCDLELTSADIGHLNVAFLIGGVCSSFLWGAIADLVGRRRVLLGTLLFNSVVTFTGALQSTLILLAACRCINGFLTGAAGSITFNYVSEFHVAAHRARSVCCVGIAYTSAWLLLPILARLILPLPPASLAGITTWRLFLAVIALPELLAGVALLFLPESPKYMAEKDQEQALTILAWMYAGNHRCDPNGFPVRQLSAPSKDQECRIADEGTGNIRRLTRRMCDDFRHIFVAPLATITLLVSCVMFCNMFGYFGFGLWLPELFQRFELRLTNRTTTLDHLLEVSCTPDFDAELFQSTLAIGAAALCGNLMAGWLAGRLPLRVVPCLTFLVGSVTSGLIYFLTASWQHLLVACIFQAVMAMANITLGGIVVEVYPTKCAGIALCWTLFIGRTSAMLSNLLFGAFIDTACEIPIFSVSAILLLGTVFSLCMPSRGECKYVDMSRVERAKVEVAVIMSNQ